MRPHIAFLITDLIWFLLFIRPFSARALRFCWLGNQKLLPDPQLPWIVNAIERRQIVVRNFQLLCDPDGIIAFLYNVSFS